jgi:hypothetical protein
MRRVWLLAVALALAVLLAVTTGRLFVWPVTDPPDRADAVLVFAGKRERLAEGIRLMRVGVAPVLVISDGAGPAPAPGGPAATRRRTAG